MRQIPIQELIGDVVEKSDRSEYCTTVSFRSGRFLTIEDGPFHKVKAWEPNT